MQEIWKDVQGYEGYYQVSNFGRFRSLDRVVIHGNYELELKGKIFKGRDNKRGYLLVSLCKDNNTLNSYIHRLVATLYVSNPYNKKEVNHIDGNKLNNHYLNLEWCTRSDNLKHAYDNGLKQGYWKGKKGNVTNNKPISKYSLNNIYICGYLSATEACRKTGIARTSITSCATGNNKTAGGYIWKYQNVNT